MKDKLPKLLFNISLLAGVWCIVLQNAGLLTPPSQEPQKVFIVNRELSVEGTVDVGSVSGSVDVNLSEVVGLPLIRSERGMFIGVASADGKQVIPIHWGQVEVPNPVTVSGVVQISNIR